MKKVLLLVAALLLTVDRTYGADGDEQTLPQHPWSSQLVEHAVTLLAAQPPPPMVRRAFKMSVNATTTDPFQPAQLIPGRQPGRRPAPFPRLFPGPDEVLGDIYSGNDLADGTPLLMERDGTWYDVTVMDGHIVLPPTPLVADMWCLVPVGDERLCPNMSVIRIHQTVSVKQSTIEP